MMVLLLENMGRQSYNAFFGAEKFVLSSLDGMMYCSERCGLGNSCVHLLPRHEWWMDAGKVTKVSFFGMFL